MLAENSVAAKKISEKRCSVKYHFELIDQKCLWSSRILSVAQFQICVLMSQSKKSWKIAAEL